MNCKYCGEEIIPCPANLCVCKEPKWLESDPRWASSDGGYIHKHGRWHSCEQGADVNHIASLGSEVAQQVEIILGE